MTILHVSVFKQCLLNNGVWDPEYSHESEVEMTLARRREAHVKYGENVYKARGPFPAPIAIDGVWVF